VDAETTAFLAPLNDEKDLRFSKDEKKELGVMYTASKRALFEAEEDDEAPNAALAALAKVTIDGIEKLASQRRQLAPTAELGAPDAVADVAMTSTTVSSHEAQLHKLTLARIATEKFEGPDAYAKALVLVIRDEGARP
jgi:hypothetical protein